MTASLAQAVADARESEAEAAQLAQILAVVQAVQAATPAAHGACSCSTHATPRRSVGTTAAWVAGGAACACVLVGLFLAVALTAIAVTVGGCISYLLIRQIQTDRKGK